MARSSKCRHVKPHCRNIAVGKKAKSPCVLSNGGNGTKVKGHYSPNSLCKTNAAKITARAQTSLARSDFLKKRASATKLQAALRAMSARRKVSAKRKTASKSKSAGKKRKTPAPSGPVRKSARTHKPNPKYM